jgi:hypothetical protein
VHYNACLGGEFGEKCIIVQFLKAEKDRKSASTQRRRDRTQKAKQNPGVEMRRRISFESTNPIGSSQDDGLPIRAT